VRSQVGLNVSYGLCDRCCYNLGQKMKSQGQGVLPAICLTPKQIFDLEATEHRFYLHSLV